MRRIRESVVWQLAVLALGAAPSVHAQLASSDPDWKEMDSPVPPAYSTERMIPVDVQSAGLKFGIDPSTLSVDADGVVRYVIVARSATGARTALFEGIRCATGQVRTYARKNADESWSPVRDGDWRSLRDGQRSVHAHAAARQGLCVGNSTPWNTREIVRALNTPAYDK